MKYFIDFEATQFTQEIISIGCVNENGKEYYSLIKPKKMKNLTKFITELTGITQEMLVAERNSDEVFAEFFDWMQKDCNDSVAEFYCYGTSDKEFLRKNLKDRTNNFKAQAALSMIMGNLINYSMNVRTHFGLIKDVGLSKVADYFNSSEIASIQNHNALEDAKMLYKVYLGVENEKEIIGIPFIEYRGLPSSISRDMDLTSFNIERFNNGEHEANYGSLEEAIDYIINDLGNKGNRKNISKKIVNAINCKRVYCGFEWKINYKKEK